jgi:hypothetical protein
LIVSAVSVPFTFTHAVEDFSVDIHERFGLALLPAVLLLSLVYATQVAAAALSAHDRPLGHGLNFGVALVWLFGSVLDHLGEVLFEPNALYRAGFVSKLLEIGIMLSSAIWGTLALRALRERVWPRRNSSPSQATRS